MQLLQLPEEPEEYLSWEELRRRNPPSGLSVEEWWYGVRAARNARSRIIPLCHDTKGRLFSFNIPAQHEALLHRITKRAAGQVALPAGLTSREESERYYISSLIEEAITSSQLEGAATTSRDAREMLRRDEPPADKDQRMILNNYLTMRRLREIAKLDLTPELILEIHRAISDGVLDVADGAGRLRREDENIQVVDELYGEVYHTPPSASELPLRMYSLCMFANEQGTNKNFLHPVIRSILIHFWLAYDHPFVDGNGRTARALFYWSMLRHGYWLFEYVSISRILNRSRVAYGRSFLYAETDGNDATYFIDNQLKAISMALEELEEYIRIKREEMAVVDRLLGSSATLNYRQRALLSHALRHPGRSYTVKSHQTSHNVSLETARKDLAALEEDFGLLKSRIVRRQREFVAIPNLEQRVANLSSTQKP